MPATKQAADELVALSVKIPRSRYQRITELAQQRLVSVAAQAEELLENGLDSAMSAQEQFDRLSEMYRARLEQDGTLNRTTKQVLTELNAARERIANELYPD